MPKTKKPVPPPEKQDQSFNISDCNFHMSSAANEHTRDAVVALAEAAKANAGAIEAAAHALTRSAGESVAIKIQK